MSVYELTLKTIAPVHIGDGFELRQDFDFCVHQGRTYRLDEDAILLAMEDKLKQGSGGRYPLPGQLLQDSDFSKQHLFRYVLRGTPRSRRADARLQSFIKDVYDRPYIPGSSLKGAFRTALAWTGWGEVQPRLERSSIGRSRNWAGQPLERKLFGPDPNHDLLRALHVSDLFGPEKPDDSMLVVNAQVMTAKTQGSPIELEALPGDITFGGSMTIDDTLFESWADRELKFSNRRHWLNELMTRAQAHSLARIERLIGWFGKVPSGEAILRFYRKLQNSHIQENQALMQLGWGSGWDGKTFGTHLQSDPGLFERLIRDFRLQRAGRRGARRQVGDPFPSSRRVAIGGRGTPVAPFGWVLVEMKTR